MEWQAGQSERGNARRVNEFMIRKCSKSSAVYLTVGIEGAFPIFPHEQTLFALSIKVWNEIFLGSDYSIVKDSNADLTVGN